MTPAPARRVGPTFFVQSAPAHPLQPTSECSFISGAECTTHLAYASRWSLRHGCGCCWRGCGSVARQCGCGWGRRRPRGAAAPPGGGERARVARLCVALVADAEEHDDTYAVALYIYYAQGPRGEREAVPGVTGIPTEASLARTRSKRV